MINGHKVYIIAACDAEQGIGKNNTLPWRLHADMRHFKKVTTTTHDKEKKHMVIMGRRTWDSIPEQYRPLPDRINVVLSRNLSSLDHVTVVKSLEEACHSASDNVEHIFIIGGGQLYAEAINADYIDGIYLTKIQHTFEADVFFPTIPKRMTQEEVIGTGEEGGLEYTFYFYSPK